MASSVMSFLGVAIIFTIVVLAAKADLGTGPACSVQDEESCGEYYDVLIVGAGPSGANSAYQLRNRGKRIGVFEMSDRIGGRLYTVRLPETPDINMEFGGTVSLPDKQRHLRTLIEDLGIQMYPDAGSESVTTHNKIYFLRNERVSPAEFKKGNVPFDLTQEERDNVHRLKSYYIEKLTGRPLPEQAYTREELLELTDTKGRLLYEITADEAMDQVFSKDGKELFREMHFIDTDLVGDASAIRFVDFFNSGALSPDRHVRRMKDGMSSIPRTLLNAYLEANSSNTLQYYRKLKSISDKRVNGWYQLTFHETEPKEWTAKEKQPRIVHTVYAKQVILALPLKALTNIDWPPLKSEKMKWAIEARTTVPAAKFYMTFKDRWWPDSTIISDSRVSFMVDKGQSNVTGVHAMLASYSDLKDALYFQALNRRGKAVTDLKGALSSHTVSDVAMEEILVELARAMDVSRDEIPDPISAISHFWVSEPFGGGWVSSRAGYNLDDIVSITRRPDIQEDVYVVGSDHAWGTCAYWTEGALETSQYVIDTYIKE